MQKSALFANTTADDCKRLQIGMRRIVNALLVRNGAVLLAKRSPAKRAYPATWSFPGGHVEPGEALDDALVREVSEEVGLVPTCLRELGTIEEPNPAAYGAVTYHLYAVTAWDGGEPVLVGDEHTELRWCALEPPLSGCFSRCRPLSDWFLACLGSMVPGPRTGLLDPLAMTK